MIVQTKTLRLSYRKALSVVPESSISSVIAESPRYLARGQSSSPPKLPPSPAARLLFTVGGPGRDDSESEAAAAGRLT
jgi:hypothetical protein